MRCAQIAGIAFGFVLLAGCAAAPDTPVGQSPGPRGAGLSQHSGEDSPASTAALASKTLSREAGSAPTLWKAPTESPSVTEELPIPRRATLWESETEHPRQRVDEATSSKLGIVRALFADAGVTFPPSQMLLRAFKRDRRLELWAASRMTDPLVHVTTYEICAISGVLGPKRREGDGQVPEGFYTLSDYVPAGRYYLAMLVNYPNLSDQILGDKRKPGGEIMIHGRCVSIGCLAMSDERIQEIWVAATALRYAGGTVHVHIFPSRDMRGLLASGEQPEHRAFWENVREGLEEFERNKRIPAVRVDQQGRYSFPGIHF